MTIRRPIILVALVLVAGLALGSAPRAAAHHGWSGYDSGTTLNLTGTIKEAGYEHPHGYVQLQVPGKIWRVVLAPPSRMENRGLPRTALSPGKTVTVVGYPNRTDPEEMRAERIIVDGKTTELR
jgi:Family of unknown function (DUF6152)